MTDNRGENVLHMVCCDCGTSLGKYVAGSRHTTFCRKCSAELEIYADPRDARVHVISRKQERKREHPVAG